MHIVVLVKQVPDTWTQKRLSETDATLDRGGDAVLNELDEYAVEEALTIAEAHGGEVTVLSMGPPRAVETIRKALSMGADKAVHLCDDALHGSDAVQTSYAIAQALGTLTWDMVILGSESTDARMSVLPAMLAERLGVAQLSLARKVQLDGALVRIERVTEDGFERVEGSIPVVISVVEKINKPRYPTFKNIVAAKKKPLSTLSLADAGIDPAKVGLAQAATAVVDVTEQPPRGAGRVVQDTGDGAVQIADFLAAKKLI